jgi:CheY-like chemotaxis protein
VVIEPRAPPPVVLARGETVLAVEDNAVLRRVVLRQLCDLGYRVLEAENATAALALLEREKIDVMFTDIIMAGAMDGYSLAQQANARFPALKVVLTSGFPQTKTTGPGIGVGDQGGAFRLLSKPYRREDLARALRDALDS